MFHNYFEVRDWLEGFIPFTYTKKNLGLERTIKLLELLGNPQKKFKSIHVAGTNGKGSTAYYIAKLLQCKSEIRNPKSETNSNVSNSIFQNVSNLDIRASNFPLKVGLHISPHLVDIRERMQVFQQETGNRKQETGLMQMGRFLQLFSEIALVVERIKKKTPNLTPSYFEILVAASFLYFAQEKVDLAVVEVGLGGRLDATNVLEPEVSVITNVGLDHTELLGKTVEEIAWEKAGIIKKGVPLVTGAAGKALEVVEKEAKEKGSEVIKISTLFEKSDNKFLLNSQKSGSNFVAQNIFLAMGAVTTLGLNLEPSLVEKVVSTGLPGRFEEIEKGPTSPKGLRGTSVILDGAHNEDKISTLIDFVNKFPICNCQFSIILVVAFKKGKNWKKMVDMLVKELPVCEVIATEFKAVTDTGRFGAVKAEKIADYVKKLQIPLSTRNSLKASNSKFQNSQEAVFEALRYAQRKPLRQGFDDELGRIAQGKHYEKEIVLVTGSLYLVGEVRTVWKLPEF